MRAANVKNFILAPPPPFMAISPKFHTLKAPDRHTAKPLRQKQADGGTDPTDLQKAQPDWSIALLRYFNRLARIRRAIWAKIRKAFRITDAIHRPGCCRPSRLAGDFWYDYPTEDGTGVRDYIHVMDLGTVTSWRWKNWRTSQAYTSTPRRWRRQQRAGRG